MKGCLADGYPFLFGFTAYDAFESAQVANTGKLNMPKKAEKVLGGHAVLAVGYDDASKRLIISNSWGQQLGKERILHYALHYLLDENLSDDFWTIRVVEENPALKK